MEKALAFEIELFLLNKRTRKKKHSNDAGLNDRFLF